MIGLIDYDLQTSTSVNLHPPNLEIMKLATYYKLEQQHFCRLMSLNETELTAYDKIYFFSEAETRPEVPEAFLKSNNVIYGGTAFTNGIYQPFKNELIDFTLAKPAIYKEYLKQCFQDGIKSRVIGHILDDSYFRQYAGKNKLPLPAILPHKRLWVYDIDFMQPGWEEWVAEADKRMCSSVATIHPIFCHKMSEFMTIRSMPKIARSNEIILDLNIPLEETRYLFKEYKKFFLADITRSTTVALKIGGTFATNFQHYNDLIYKLNLLYCFWSNSIPIKLRYFPPQLGTNCSITKLLRAIETWANSVTKPERTINDKITHRTMRKPTPAYAEELLVLKFHPTAADLFKQSYQDLSTRGFWRI